MAKEVKQAANQGIEGRYPPSWIDRLIKWIDRLPGPAWLFYLAGVLALAAAITVVLWIDGSVLFGSYGSFQGVFPPFVFYFLALYHYLTRVGSRSLQEFRPLLELENADFARTDYELATLPRGLGWLAVALAIGTMPPYFLGGQAFGDRAPHTVFPYVIAVAATGFFGATIFCLIFRGLRQLRMVHNLHTQAAKINLLKLGPAHAFSALTARFGIGIILVFVLGYIYNPSAFYGGWLLVGYLVMTAPAVIVFAVPVMGMRDRLSEEKKRALDETSDLLQMANDKLAGMIRADEYTNVQGLNSAMGALTRKREMLVKISTWPWNPGTLRGFASTLLLPILLWLITRLLERFV